MCALPYVPPFKWLKDASFTGSVGSHIQFFALDRKLLQQKAFYGAQ